MMTEMDVDIRARSRWRAPLIVGPGVVLAVAIVLTGAVILVRAAMPEPRPVVLTVYCASSATWVNAFAPLLDAQPQTDGEPERGRVTSARIKSAYERRCTSPD
jgi:hypothetical protein